MDEFALNVKCWCEGYFICEYTITHNVSCEMSIQKGIQS